MSAAIGADTGTSSVVAVGAGARGGLWTQIVSNLTGSEQVVPEKTTGYGGALLAASFLADVDIAAWNPPQQVVSPDSERAGRYTKRYGIDRELSSATRPVVHALARVQAAEAAPS